MKTAGNKHEIFVKCGTMNEIMNKTELTYRQNGDILTVTILVIAQICRGKLPPVNLNINLLFIQMPYQS